MTVSCTPSVSGNDFKRGRPAQKRFLMQWSEKEPVSTPAKLFDLFMSSLFILLCEITLGILKKNKTKNHGGKMQLFNLGNKCIL